VTDTTPEGWQLSDTEIFSKYGQVFVPRRHEQARTVCDLLSDIPVRHVLDLGCGEGRLSEEFLRRSGDARVTLLDDSAEMLGLAAARLSRFAGRHDQVRANLQDREWRQGTYGGVMTSLAVHHLDGPEKQALYRDIHAMLAPGGVFVMVDLVEPAGPGLRRLAADFWDEAVHRASQEEFGGDEAEKVFAGEKWNYFRLPGPDEVDKPSSVAEHLDWLRAARFEEADVAWLYAGHAVLAGRKGGHAGAGQRRRG
jgi:tRNA (cmo5U34)-methyltransferase